VKRLHGQRVALLVDISIHATPLVFVQKDCEDVFFVSIRRQSLLVVGQCEGNRQVEDHLIGGYFVGVT